MSPYSLNVILQSKIMEFLSKNRIICSCISGFADDDVIELGFSDILSRSDLYDANCCSRGKMNRFELDGATKRDSHMRATAASFACGLPNFIKINSIYEPSQLLFLRQSKMEERCATQISL